MNSTLHCFSSKYRAKKKTWESVEISGIPVEILHGSLSQTSLPTSVAGTQCTACVMTAVALSGIKCVSTWNSGTIDDVLRIATRRHEKCPDKDERGFADVVSFLNYSEVPGYKGRVILREELTCNGFMSEDLGAALKIPPAVGIFSDFITRKWDSVATLNDFSVGVIVGADHCYLFNSHPCNNVGKPDSDGFACVIKIPMSNSPWAVESIISSNYGPKNKPEGDLYGSMYCIVGISKQATHTMASVSETSKIVGSGQTPSSVIDSDDSESDFNPAKSKLPLKNSSTRDGSFAAKFDKITEGFRAYKLGSLPARYEQLNEWFRKLDVKLVSTTCVPSASIQHNLIVVYSARAMETSDDFYWRKDGFSWTPGPHNKLPRDNPKYNTSYHYLRTDVKGVHFTRTEVSPLALKDGKHDWDELKRHEWPVVLVHYRGGGKINKVKSMPHGNRKYTPQKMSSKRALELITNTPTTPEFQRQYTLPPNEPKSKLLRRNLRRKLQFTDTPYQTFAVERAEQESKGQSSVNLLTPRNVNQVKSVKSAMKKEGSFADPVQLLVHHSILHKDLLPIYARQDGYLHVVATLPPLDSHFRDVLAAGKKIIFHYDTTFNCGDFYVSILNFRHEFLQDSPILPLRFLFHENKSSFGHDLMFKNLLKTFPMLKKMEVVLVTDREAAFKNLKQRYLPSASHIFCHLHIYRNAEEWCKQHGQSAKAKEYCDSIRRLLHSNSYENYQDVLDSCAENWSASFLRYFHVHLSQDIQMSSKFTVKDLIQFDNTSGVTNNASEAINASYKQWLCGRKSMYEAVLRAYFYQIAKFVDIRDAFAGQDSKFKVNRQKMAPDFVFDPTADIISELGITSIFGEGTFSNNVTNYKPKNVDIKSTMGLAWWFVRNKRITYVDQDCFVKGLNRRSFHVDAVRKFCTCLRPSCAHLQAVLIQQRRAAITSGKHNLTKTSTIYRPLKRAGMKLSDKLRKRGRLPLQPERKRELIQATKSVALKKLMTPLDSFSRSVPEPLNTLHTVTCEEQQESQKVFNLSQETHRLESSETELQQKVGRQHNVSDILAILASQVNLYEMTQLPLLSARNAEEVVLRVQGQAITLLDLKTLDEDIKRSEEAAIKKITKGFQRGHLSAAVVNSFIGRLVNKNIALVLSNYAMLATQNDTSKKIDAAIKKLKTESWDGVHVILLPFIRAPEVWNLGVVQVTTEGVMIFVIDPRNPLEVDEQLAKNFHSFVSTVNPYISTEFQVRPPTWKLPQTLTISSSGVLVCMYALCFAKQISTSASMSALEMRQVILSVICSGCAIKCKKDRLLCPVCGLKCSEEATVSCLDCQQRAHVSCMDIPNDQPSSDKYFSCGQYQGKFQ